jgi:hypothetical protein
MDDLETPNLETPNLEALNLETLKGELEIERRSIAMMPPASSIPKEKALDLVRRCQAAIAASQARGRIG